MTKTKKTNDISESSSARSESSKKTSISDDETQTSFEYLKNNTKSFLGDIQIFLIQI